MKISRNDYNALRIALLDTLQTYKLLVGQVKTETDAWDVFHRAWKEKRLDGNLLYRDYTDSHLATAMRKIFNIAKTGSK